MKVPQKSQIRLLQWNCRSISTNLAFLKHFLQSHLCEVLILQSLNTTSTKLPRLPNYYHPPVYEVGNSGKKISTAIYILKELQYNVHINSVLKTYQDIHACAATVKFSNALTLNVMSVYLPKGPNDQNTEWLRTISDQQRGKWVIGGDFNAHSPFWEKDCSNITSNRFVENTVDSSFFLLNDGTVTRIPDVSTHRPQRLI